MSAREMLFRLCRCPSTYEAHGIVHRCDLPRGHALCLHLEKPWEYLSAFQWRADNFAPQTAEAE